MNNIIIKSIFSVLIISGLSCNSKADSEGELAENTETSSVITLTPEQFKNLDAELAQMTTIPFNAEIEVRGLVDVPPENIAKVSSAIPGVIKTITHNVLPGKFVKKGEVLAVAHSMDLVQLQQDYLEAFLKNEVLTQELNRQKDLIDGGAGVLKKEQSAESELKLNKARVTGLAAKLKIVNVNLEKLKEGNINPQLYIYAPFSGYIKDVHVNTGTNFSSTDVLFELISKEHLHVELSVFEKDASYLKTGQKVQLSGANVPDGSKGSIFLISKSYNQDSKAINVHVHLDDERNENQLIPGQYLQARIQMEQKMTNVLPESALIREGKNTFVFVKKDSENSFEKVAVEIGETKNNMTEIRSPNTLKNVAISKVHLISGMNGGEE